MIESPDMCSNFVLSIPILLLVGAAGGHAQDLFTTSFDSPTYRPGSLTNQSGWYVFGGTLGNNGGNPTVQSTDVRSGDQAISTSASAAVGYPLHTISYSDSGLSKIVEGSVSMKMGTLGSAWHAFCFISASTTNPTVGCLDISTSGLPYVTNGPTQKLGPGTLSAGTWYTFRLAFDFTAQTMTGFIDGVSIGSVPFASAVRNLAAVGFGFNAIPGANVAYYDDFSVTASAGPVPALRSSQPVLQSFSGLPGLSSGTWLELYGTNLSATTREWGCADFTANCTQAPTALDGVRVSINNKPAFVRYISPTQINVAAPDDGGATGPVQITVTNATGTSASLTLNKTAQSPALLTTPSFNVGGKQYVAALHSDNATFVGRTGLIAGAQFRPANPGNVIIIYAVGCGPTSPASASGAVLPAPLPLAGAVQVMFGQTVAQAQAFVSALGLCQFNVTVPSLPSGDIAITASVNGTGTGQALFTTIQ